MRGPSADLPDEVQAAAVGQRHVDDGRVRERVERGAGLGDAARPRPTTSRPSWAGDHQGDRLADQGVVIDEHDCRHALLPSRRSRPRAACDVRADRHGQTVGLVDDRSMPRGTTILAKLASVTLVAPSCSTRINAVGDSRVTSTVTRVAPGRLPRVGEHPLDEVVELQLDVRGEAHARLPQGQLGAQVRRRGEVLDGEAEDRAEGPVRALDHPQVRDVAADALDDLADLVAEGARRPARPVVALADEQCHGVRAVGEGGELLGDTVVHLAGEAVALLEGDAAAEPGEEEGCLQERPPLLGEHLGGLAVAVEERLPRAVGDEEPDRLLRGVDEGDADELTDAPVLGVARGVAHPRRPGRMQRGVLAVRLAPREARRPGQRDRDRPAVVVGDERGPLAAQARPELAERRVAEGGGVEPGAEGAGDLLQPPQQAGGLAGPGPVELLVGLAQLERPRAEQDEDDAGEQPRQLAAVPDLVDPALEAGRRGSRRWLPWHRSR